MSKTLYDQNHPQKKLVIYLGVYYIISQWPHHRSISSRFGPDCSQFGSDCWFLSWESDEIFDLLLRVKLNKIVFERTECAELILFIYSKWNACDTTPLWTSADIWWYVCERDLNCNNVLKTTLGIPEGQGFGLHICKNRQGQPSAYTQPFDNAVFVKDTQGKLWIR